MARRFHQRNRKLVASSGDFFSGGNQECRLAVIPGKERAEPVFGGVFLGVVGQHEEPSFVVASLPRGQEAIGGRESGYVVGISNGLNLGTSERRSEGKSQQKAEEDDGVGYATESHNPLCRKKNRAPKNSRRASF